MFFSPKHTPDFLQLLCNLTIDIWGSRDYNIVYIPKDFEGKLVFPGRLQRAGGRCEPELKGQAIWFLSRFCEPARQ